MTTKTQPAPIRKSDEMLIGVAKSNVKTALRIYRQCRRPSREARYLDSVMMWRAQLQEACAGDERFRAEWHAAQQEAH